MTRERLVPVVLGVLFGLTALGSASSAVVAPDIASDLGLRTSGIAAVFVAFSIAFAATTAIYGRLGDIHGERNPLVAGIAIMAVGSVISAAAPNLLVLVGGRLVQGAGAGAVPALVPGVLRSRVPDDDQPAALGVVAATAGVFAAVGPLLGGLAGAALGWRLAMVLPFAGVALIPIMARLADGAGAAERALDRRGAVLVASLVTGVVLVLQAPGLGVIVGLVGGVASVGAAFAWWHHQRIDGDGFTPDVIVRTRSFWLNATVGASLSAVYLSILLAVPVRLADTEGWSAIQIGAALVPAAAVGPVASTVGRRVTMRISSQTVAGLGVVVAGLGCIAAAAIDRPIVQVVGFGSAILGFGLAQPALIDRIARSTDVAHRGVAVGLFNLMFFVGGAVGSALVGSFGIDGGSAIAAVAALAAGGLLAVPHDTPFSRCLHSTGTVAGAVHCLTNSPTKPIPEST